MGENSTIEWTDHTFNPWMGCTKVSPGCAHCYAERDMDHRYGKVKWGKGSPRVRTTAANWPKPLAWDKAAAKAGRRDRVFCASLADVFDDEVPSQWRCDLFTLIMRTPNLDWLLLTKRPQNIAPMLDAIRDLMDEDTPSVLSMMPLPNVWLGTTVEDQASADKRIPALLAIPARVRFLSCEPLLGPVDLSKWLWVEHSEVNEDFNGGWCRGPLRDARILDGGTDPVGLHWVIAGGESGPDARPMHPDWARSLRDQCQAAGVPFLFKQWGEWAPGYHNQMGAVAHRNYERWMATDGELVAPYSDERAQAAGRYTCIQRIGKAKAGRHLDGVTHDAVPTP